MRIKQFSEEFFSRDECIIEADNPATGKRDFVAYQNTDTGYGFTKQAKIFKNAEEAKKSKLFKKLEKDSLNPSISKYNAKMENNKRYIEKNLRETEEIILSPVKLIYQDFEESDERPAVHFIVTVTSPTFEGEKYLRGSYIGIANYEEVWHTDATYNDPADGEGVYTYIFDDAELDNCVLFDTLEEAKHPQMRKVTKDRKDRQGNTYQVSYWVCDNESDTLWDDVDDEALCDLINWDEVPEDDSDDLSDYAKNTLRKRAAEEDNWE